MYKLLNQYIVDNKSKLFSHSSFDGKLWYVPDDELTNFYDSYIIILNNSDEYPCIVEHHNNMKYSPIIIDIDIKQSSCNRQFNSSFLKELYDEFLNCLNEIFIDDSNFTCYILSRDKPYFDKKNKLYKDGLHIYFPNIITSYDFQFRLRQQMIPYLKNIFINIENLNTIEDTYDISVIKRNGMFLIGSTKFGTTPYVINKIYNLDEDIKKDKNKYNNDVKFLLDTLSLRNKMETTIYKNQNIENEYNLTHIDTLLNNKKIKNYDKNIDEKNMDDKKIDDEYDDESDNEYVLENNFCNISEQEMSDYIYLLPEEYCENYNKWLKIGAILYNTNPKFKELFRDFSQKSEKYDFNDFEKMWETYSNFNGEKVNFGSLVEIFKQNNLIDEYRKIKHEYKTSNDNITRKNNFEECVKNNKKFFDKKSQLKIENMYSNNSFLCGATLCDKYCPHFKGKHEMAYSTINLINAGILYQYCGLCKQMFPPNGIQLELNIIQNIFGNTIINNNYYGTDEQITNYRISKKESLDLLLECINIDKRITEKKDWIGLANLIKKEDYEIELFAKYTHNVVDYKKIWNNKNKNIIDYKTIRQWSLEDNPFKLFDKKTFEINEINHTINEKLYDNLDDMYNEIFWISRNFIYLINDSSRKIVLKVKNKDSNSFCYDIVMFQKFKKEYDDIILFYKDPNEKIVKIKFVDILSKIRGLNYKGIYIKPYNILSTNNIQDNEYVNVFSPMIGELVDDFDIIKIDIILNHIREVWCDDDDFMFKYIMTYLSQIIQTPHKKTDICLVLAGEQGSGKTLILEDFIKHCLGNNCGIQINGLKDILDKTFQSFLVNKLLILAEEPTALSDMSFSTYVESLKNFITTNKMGIEKKFCDKITYDVFHNLIITCNHLNGIHLQSEYDRRFCIVNCSLKYIGNFEYFKRLKAATDNKDIMNIFFTYLFNYNDKVDLHPIPLTGIKKDKIEENKIINKITKKRN